MIKWDHRRIARLKRLLDKGFSRGRIAKLMQLPLGSITGKTQRLGYHFRSRNRLPDAVVKARNPMIWRRFVWKNWVKPRLKLQGPCWIWPGSTTLSGYGRVHIGSAAKGKSHRLNRLVLEVKLGRVLKPAECALHTCDRPLCLRPAHLFKGTQADNNKDKVKKGRHATGERSGIAKLTDVQVKAIRAMQTQMKPPITRTALIFADALGVSASYLWELWRPTSSHRRL